MSGLAITLNSVPDTDIISFAPDSNEPALPKSCYRMEVDKLRRQLLCQQAEAANGFDSSENPV
jgi:hypothetical protein